MYECTVCVPVCVCVCLIHGTVFTFNRHRAALVRPTIELLNNHQADFEPAQVCPTCGRVAHWMPLSRLAMNSRNMHTEFGYSYDIFRCSALCRRTGTHRCSATTCWARRTTCRRMLRHSMSASRSCVALNSLSACDSLASRGSTSSLAKTGAPWDELHSHYTLSIVVHYWLILLPKIFTKIKALFNLE